MANISVVITVKNEERNLADLFAGLERQSKLPNEVVIVDGGSTDRTHRVLMQWKPPFRKVIIRKSGNRSVGRNAGILVARNSIIALTDAGCVPARDWIKNVTAPLISKKTDVVAGYYEANAHTPFERAAAAYMLVMPEHVNERNFLPATRSMALLKSAWKRVGGFDERYTWNEDYVFAHALKNSSIKIKFIRSAVVRWLPPANWLTWMKQIFRFAVGDTQAGIFRPKVLFMFARYTVWLLMYIWMPWIALLLLPAYFFWSIQKNWRYVRSFSAVYLLPFLQVSSDVGVMCGSIIGMFHYVWSTYL